MLDRFQIGFFYDYNKYTIWENKPVLYFNKKIGADSIKHLYGRQLIAVPILGVPAHQHCLVYRVPAHHRWLPGHCRPILGVLV
jgi:hypothetical protein